MTSLGNWTVAKPNLETDLFEPCNYHNHVISIFLLNQGEPSKIEIDGILP